MGSALPIHPAGYFVLARSYYFEYPSEKRIGEAW